jgi:hypothetical protein
VTAAAPFVVSAAAARIGCAFANGIVSRVSFSSSSSSLFFFDACDFYYVWKKKSTLILKLRICICIYIICSVYNAARCVRSRSIESVRACRGADF